MNKLIEKLNRLVEFQVDPELRDIIQRGSDRLKQHDKDILDKEKRALKKHPDDNSFKKRYSQALRDYKSSNDFDNLYKYLYAFSEIDLQQATIDKVPVPKNKEEAQILINDGRPTIFSSGDKLFSYSGDGYLIYGPRSLENEIDINGKRVDLRGRKNIHRLFNSGLIDNAWKINGPSTEELRKQRADAKSGAVEKSFLSFNTDKSGYQKRDLAQELADRRSGNK